LTLFQGEEGLNSIYKFKYNKNIAKKLIDGPLFVLDDSMFIPSNPN